MTHFHEPVEQLSPDTRNYIRAINSLQEELEAVDWYQQRIDACTDDQLRRILEHNRDEEMEHACMSLEWLRRNQPGWDGALRRYLFTMEDIVAIEDHHTGSGGEPGTGGDRATGSAAAGRGDGSLGLGRVAKSEQEE